MPAVQTNGTTLHYEIHGSSDAPTVLALHAATVSGGEMLWVRRFLNAAGLRAILPDLRGHGQTPNPAPDMHMPRMVDDVAGLLDQLDAPPLHGFGYSMGGGVLLYTALRHPDWFKSLVLLGSNYKAASLDTIERVVGPAEHRTPIQRAVFDTQTGVRIGWDATPQDFAVLRMPVLLVLGDRDEFLDIEEVLPLFRALPNAQLLVVPGTSHLRLVNHPLLLEGMRRFYTRIGVLS
ncbi:MAG: alpha/beta hydrolase [Chloroflexi bacterium]|nr:alpha/beta hydrolase [Chloroflexota bacterium]